MLPYLLKRFATSLAIVVVAIALIFCMIYVIPGDPVKVALGPRATPEMIASFRQHMGLDLPLYRGTADVGTGAVDQTPLHGGVSVDSWRPRRCYWTSRSRYLLAGGRLGFPFRGPRDGPRTGRSPSIL